MTRLSSKGITGFLLRLFIMSPAIACVIFGMYISSNMKRNELNLLSVNGYQDFVVLTTQSEVIAIFIILIEVLNILVLFFIMKYIKERIKNVK